MNDVPISSRPITIGIFDSQMKMPLDTVISRQTSTGATYRAIAIDDRIRDRRGRGTKFPRKTLDIISSCDLARRRPDDSQIGIANTLAFRMAWAVGDQATVTSSIGIPREPPIRLHIANPGSRAGVVEVVLSNRLDDPRASFEMQVNTAIWIATRVAHDADRLPSRHWIPYVDGPLG